MTNFIFKLKPPTAGVCVVMATHPADPPYFEWRLWRKILPATPTKRTLTRAKHGRRLRGQPKL